MKYFLINTVLDTKSFSTTQEMEEALQKKLDAWLGKDKTQIKVTALNDHTIQFTLYRKYGSWYEDPQMTQPNHDVFCWDEVILEGDGWEYGTTADLETHTGRYVIYHDEKDFFYDYKGLARKHHCTPIKSLSQQSYLDRIEFTVELHSRAKKTSNP